MSLRSSFGRRIERHWYQPSLASLLLAPLGWLFGAGVAARRFAYRNGWLQTIRCRVPVIVVGNISVGGTGKTPCVAWLVGELQARGYHPAIISRGYGGSVASPTLVAADSLAERVGDEPVLLFRRLGVPVCVCPDRVAGVEHVLAKTNATIIIADDGLQHYRLGRDLEIAVVDGARGLGNGRLLPAGPLREPSRRLSEVDLVLVNGPGKQFSGLQFSLLPGQLERLDKSRRVELGAMSGRRVWALAGIGNPERFFELLKAANIQVDRVAPGDHQRADLTALLSERQQPILMTEKDAVKYPEFANNDAWYLPVELTMPAESKAAVFKLFDKVIAHVRD